MNVTPRSNHISAEKHVCVAEECSMVWFFLAMSGFMSNSINLNKQDWLENGCCLDFLAAIAAVIYIVQPTNSIESCGSHPVNLCGRNKLCQIYCTQLPHGFEESTILGHTERLPTGLEKNRICVFYAHRGFIVCAHAVLCTAFAHTVFFFVSFWHCFFKHGDRLQAVSEFDWGGSCLSIWANGMML